MNKALLNNVSTLLKESVLSHEYRGEALFHAADLYTLTNSDSLDTKTPHDKLLKCVPSNSNILVFVCSTYAHRPKASQRLRFDDHTYTGINLGT